MSLSSSQWASLHDDICKGAVRSLQFACVDCSALDRDMLLVAAGCRGLKKLVIQQCVLPSGFVLDDLLRSSVANGVLHLRTFKNSPESARRLSDDAVLDFYFPANAAPGEPMRSLEFEGSAVSDAFLAKFFERLQTTPLRPHGSVEFHGGTAKQLGLSAYAHYLEPGGDGMNRMDATYRFPSTGGDDGETYDVGLFERPWYMLMRFSLVDYDY